MPDRFTPFIPATATQRTDGPLTLVALTEQTFRDTMTQLLESEAFRLLTMYAVDLRSTEQTFRIYYVFGHPASHTMLVPYFDTLDRFPSLALVRTQCAFYEREIATMFGLTPVGHPDPRPSMALVGVPQRTYPLRHDAALSHATSAHDPLPEYTFHMVQGEGVYEIPVGPVHAGIIEPGHFRFSVLGEEILKLDPMLGWKHKGIEKLFETVPLEHQVRLAERVSGDSSFAHSLAFCQAVEQLAHLTPLEYVRLTRTLFAELERIANHFSDIGFIMLDTAFTFGGSHGARLRERVMQWNERLTGSRFLRGVNGIGVVHGGLTADLLAALRDDLIDIRRDFDEVIHVVEGSLSFHQRVHTTGRLTREVAHAYGVVGVPARAVGSMMDARIDFPYAGYLLFDHTVVTRSAGDVQARFEVRVGEVRQSIALITDILDRLKHVSPQAREKQAPQLKKDALAVSVVEGWRGEIVYAVMTDHQGHIMRVKVRDPSFLNWQAFPETVKGEMVPDFPLVNKSFNLSYSGNDL